MTIALRAALAALFLSILPLGCNSASSTSGELMKDSPSPDPKSIRPAGRQAATVPASKLESFAGKEIGRSRQNRPIVLRQFDGPAVPGREPVAILLFAGIHGSEQTTVYASARLLEILDKEAINIVPSGHRLYVIPVANPDGYAADTRQNAAKIDLNRNFPSKNFKSTSREKKYAPGDEPLSEPESKLLHNLVIQLKPVRIMSLHSIRPPKHGNNYDGPAKALAELLATKNHYAVLSTIGYPTPGSFGSWAGIDLGIPTITLEFPSTATGPAAWAANREAILAFIRGH